MWVHGSLNEGDSIPQRYGEYRLQKKLAFPKPNEYICYSSQKFAMLEVLFTSKTRLKLLIKFFVSASNRGYLRGIADEFNESTNAIRRELNQLSEAGYLLREQQDHKVVYRANIHHSLFSSLQSLIHNFLGIDQVVDQVFERAGDVREVALLGDYAQGIDSGHIEVLVTGEDIDSAYLLQAAEKAGKLVNKKLSVYLQQPGHVRTKIVLYKQEEDLVK